MAYRYNATRRVDVVRLARNISSVPESARWKVLGHVFSMGLMRPHPLDLLMRTALWVARKKLGDRGAHEFFRLMQVREPKAVMAWIDLTAEHVLHGRDREDELSVGGWSQREMDLFCSKVQFLQDVKMEAPSVEAKTP
jgi:hypothetical protein